ncbi:MAG: replicative DNA helicase [Oscillospiraceae bacterium]|nr:replicative DNA helicase [Oscillospiraceae bacterium]
MAELSSSELLSKQIPHSTEAEQAVLGSMLIDESCIPEVISILKPDDFYLPQNREIFQTIYRMMEMSSPVDLVTVLEQMRQDGLYQENVTEKYMLQLMEITPTSANVREYALIVRDKSMLRQVATAADDITGMIQTGEGTGSEVLEAAEQKIYSIRSGRSVGGLEHISTTIQTVYERLDQLASEDSASPWLSTGLQDLDRHIIGLNPSDLIIIAGRPGMGKTSFVMNIALNVGKTSNKAVAVFSLEMSREQLAMRLISSECFVENQKLISGRGLNMDDWNRIGTAAASLSHTNILLDDNPSLTVADMNAACRRVDNLGLVVVDYLQLMQSAGGKPYANENRQQAVSDISRALKIMAKELEVPVICAAQLSRSNEKEGRVRMPRLSDLRESGAIEQDADVVLFLHREDYYDENTENRNVATCLIAKNRHGETGSISLQWVPDFTVFRSIERRYDEDGE